MDERKFVSVLFCDLVGFTAASERADPEDVAARIRPYHAMVRREVERFEGTVEKFIGDGVLAVFGAPIAHEDDPERAVRAGLRILDAIGELNGADPTLALQVRIGINSGEVLVAPSDRPEVGHGITTHGDVVNTASRLQAVAPVDGIAVSIHTYGATEGLFRYEPLEPVVVKGKSEPQYIWRPIEALARSGLDIMRSHVTSLVGRERERVQLIEAFERATRHSSCELVTVIGEPGIGKSRLCAELLRHVEARSGQAVWRQGRCLPYGDGIALWAIREIVKAQCGILESDSPAEASVKLEEALPADDADRAWLRARLEPLVGISGEPAPQQESFAAWQRFLESIAPTEPVVVCFEDLHWADDGLLSFIEYLARHAEGVPLLVLCTARPQLYERFPTWGSELTSVTTIRLSPLSDEDSARLLAMLASRAVFPAATQRTLLDRTGGNPLFLEEFVRLLIDRRLPWGELDALPVPDSVQALIAARIDALSIENKRLLQDAAVVGKVFWAGALAEIGDNERRDVLIALDELERKQLVRRAADSSMAGELEYGFWHVLVRDVCYSQMPRAVRLSGHRKAAAWIERQAGERVEDLAEVLAHHCLEALELARSAKQPDTAMLVSEARRWLAAAGTHALAFDVTSAVANLDKALELAPAGDPTRPTMLESWAQAAQQQGLLDDARSALEEAIGLYREGGRPVALGRALTALVTVLWALGDATRHQAMAEAVEVLEAQPAGPELVAAYEELAGKHLVDSEFANVIAVSDRAAALAARLGLAEPARALGFAAAARCQLGDRRGIEDVTRALSLSLEQGRGRAAAIHHANRVTAVHEFEGPNASLACARDAEAFCRRRGISEVALLVSCRVPDLLAEIGATDDALAEAAHLAEQSEVTGLTLAIAMLRSLQIRVLAERGDAPGAEALAAPLLARVRVSGALQVQAAALQACAQALLAAGEPRRAAELLDELAQVPGVRADESYAPIAPGLLRCAIRLAEAVPAPDLERWCPEDSTPLRQHALVSCRAQLAEQNEQLSDAAGLYSDAARRWQEFGNVPEQAFALLGRGRCLAALGEAAAQPLLEQARALFEAMGYVHALTETDSLLGTATLKRRHGSRPLGGQPAPIKRRQAT